MRVVDWRMPQETYHKMTKPGYARIYPGLKTIQLAERGREHGG
jgi:hypothetical protein